MESRHHIRALQVFEAVSRHRSTVKAAKELGITQSAVSHQIGRLSDIMGERLVERSGRSIALTEVGQRLAVKLQTAFRHIDDSLREAVGTPRTIVRLAVCSSFAPGWLIHSIGTFYDQFPDIDLQLSMYAKDPDLTDAVADAFVTVYPVEKGFWSLLLRPEILVPVAAPGQSGRFALITTDFAPDWLGADWRDYTQIAGLDLAEIHTGKWRQVSHYVLALEMARRGLGAALVPDFLAERDLVSGSLMRPFPQGMPTGEDYYLCIKTLRRDEPGLRGLAEWFASVKA